MSLVTFAEAMLELLQMLAPEQESHTLRALLIRDAEAMMGGSGTSLSFLRKVQQSGWAPAIPDSATLL